MKVLFYISKKYSIPIIIPLVDYAQKNDIPFAFFVSDKVYKVLSEKFDKNLLLTDINDAITFNPDFVLVPGNFVDFRIPGVKVEIFHGLGIEKKSHFKIRHFFDLYCTSGPYVTQKFMQLQKRYKYFRVSETGWPKVDYILNYQKDNINERYNVPKDKKVILYAPTHSKKMQSALDLMPHIPAIIKEDEIWFVKFHELMKKEIKENFLKTAPSNIRIISDYDITPYLYLADVLISDTSSVIYEFMILDKPVITYNTIDRKDKGLNITDKNQLREAIDKLLSNPRLHHQNRMKHLKEINPYLDGKISQRIFDALKNYVPTNKRKPLNLFRRLQIYYHQKFKKGYLR